MTNTEENCLNANNSTVPATSAHETCTQFIAYISERYPQLQSPHFRINKNGRYFTFRAAYHRRRIFAHGYDLEKTLSYFTKQVIQKISLDKYYPTHAEMREKRALEPFVVRIQCKIINNYA